MTAKLAPVASSKATRRDEHPLDVFFAPQAVAVFGATEEANSTGRTLMANLIRSPFGGTLFPICSDRCGVLGIRAYPRLQAVPAAVELAVIATPAATVPAIIGECVAARVQGAIVLSDGFGDTGPAGAELAQAIRRQLADSSLRLLGPNCLGVASPCTGLNATYAPAMVPVGNVGFLSQSGALLTALLSQDQPERVGCSLFVSVGGLLDISWAEWIDYLARDPRSECIGIYLEKMDDAAAFFAAVRKVATDKPVILVKGGDSTGEPAAGGEVFEEACRCSGILRVHKLADLFRLAEILTTSPRPRGKRLTILTNARGPGLLAADALRADGGQLASLADATIAELGVVLNGCGSPQNLIDVGDDADLPRFARAAAAAVNDPSTDALLAILTPHATIDPVQAAECLPPLARHKPVLACWMWGASDPGSLAVLRDAAIPTFRSPDAAIRVFGYLWRHAENLHFLSEINAAAAEAAAPNVEADRAERVLDRARGAGRNVLTEAEIRQLLTAYALPFVETHRAATEDAVAELARTLEFPVVLSLEAALPSRELDGVRLKAFDVPAVRRAFQMLQRIAAEYLADGPAWPVKIQPLVAHLGHEIALRSTTHAGLGPVLQFGMGARWATLAPDRVVALPPLSPHMVRRMIEKSYLFSALRAMDDPEPFNLDGLQQFVTRFSRLVVEQPAIAEAVINPLLVSADRVLALDAVIRLHDPALKENVPPRLVMARTRRG
jgi:acetyltransferase